MIIKIDTKKKEISIEETSNLGELVDYLQKTHPNSWKDFKIVQSESVVPIYPYVPQPIPLTPNQPYYYEYPTVTCDMFGGDPDDQN